MKEEIVELKFLYRHIKSVNQTLQNTSHEVIYCFERLAKVHVKEQKKNKKLLKENHKLHKMVRFLRIKLMFKYPKPRAHPDLESLAEFAANLNEHPKE